MNKPERREMASPEILFGSFVKQWAALLTRYKRDGAPIGTAVNIVVDGDHAYLRTWETAWRPKRIRNLT